MNDFFAWFYELFTGAYGTDLAEHLYGVQCNGDIGSGLYTPLGWGLWLVTLGLVIMYYYFYVNSDRNTWKHWLRFLILNAVLQFLFGFLLPYRDLVNMKICEDFDVTIDNIIFFGLVNALCGSLLFILFSFIIRWGSKTGRQTPIPR